MVEVLHSVSDEIIDRGLGMTSTRSANPTRGRKPGALSLRLGEAGGDRAISDIDCLLGGLFRGKEKP